MFDLVLNPEAVLQLQAGDKVTFEGYVLNARIYKDCIFFTSSNSQITEFNDLCSQSDARVSYNDYGKYIQHLRIRDEEEIRSMTVLASREQFLYALQAGLCLVG